MIFTVAGYTVFLHNIIIITHAPSKLITWHKTPQEGVRTPYLDADVTVVPPHSVGLAQASSDWIGFQSVSEWTHTVSSAHSSKYQSQLQIGLCCTAYCRQSEKTM